MAHRSEPEGAQACRGGWRPPGVRRQFRQFVAVSARDHVRGFPARRLMWLGGVTAVRQVVRARVYVLARRTTRRFFLLRPDRDGKMQQAFLYVLAIVAAMHGVLIHGVVLMSSHYHLVVTDVRGLMPYFLRDLNRLMAMVTKAHRQWPEEVFNKSQTSRVRLMTTGAILDKIAYVIANPVAAFAVRKARKWPGVTVMAEELGRKVFRVRRPEGYFDPNNKQWPDVAELRIVLPEQVVDELGEDGAREAIAARVADKEREAHAEAQREHKGFLGAKRVMQTRITARGTACEERGARAPTFAAAGDREAAEQAVAELRAFRAGYRDALERWRLGERDVIFPAGTWLMKVQHGVRCHPPP